MHTCTKTLLVLTSCTYFLVVHCCKYKLYELLATHNTKFFNNKFNTHKWQQNAITHEGPSINSSQGFKLVYASPKLDKKGRVMSQRTSGVKYLLNEWFHARSGDQTLADSLQGTWKGAAVRRRNQDGNICGILTVLTGMSTPLECTWYTSCSITCQWVHLCTQNIKFKHRTMRFETRHPTIHASFIINIWKT